MTGVHGVPVGLPVAWSTEPANQVPDSTRARTTAATSKRLTARASSRTGRRGLAAVRDSLSARDWRVLEGVTAHRYLTTRQVEGFWFYDHATALSSARVCRRVLRRLADLHVLTNLERRIGGVRAGSASYVWQAGPVGDRLLREQSVRPRRRQREPGLLFLDHCLAVADAHLALVQAHLAGVLELVEVQTEPDCWRPFTGLGGARLMLQPDLYVVTGDPADRAYVNRWFVEVDRGTEQLPRLRAKCGRYEAAHRAGAGQAEDEGFPLVVWVMRDEAKAARLAAAIQRDARLDDRLYRVTTLKQFVGVIRGGAA
jgi:hypothetical protein